jgi:hypothetical protein
MLSHKLKTKISKNGYLELKDLPFEKGSQLEITISRIEKKKNLNKLISNDHVWSEEDINAIKAGRAIINQWQIS